MKKIVIALGVVIIGAVSALIFFGSSSKTTTESLTIKGSDTEVQMVSDLAEAFSEKNPGNSISVTGGGSGVGIASLINGEVDVANSSRQMKQEEMDQAKGKGLDVKEFVLAIDGLSVIVHPGNGVERLSLDQLSKIYKGELKNWKQTGGNNRKIVLYGRQNTSGTYNFFRDMVVKGDYSPEMKNMEGNQAIVDAVKNDENGIGYVGVGYVKDENENPRTDIKVISVMKEAGGEAVSPLNKEAVQNGSYPIARRIFQYTSHAPKKGSLLEKFFRFEISDDGQGVVENSGFYGLTDNEKNSDNALLDQAQ